MRVVNVTIGADPELFIINEKTGKVVSSIGLIPGEKGNPWVGEDMPNGFGLETDNIAAEFNIPPVTSKGAFINNINYMLDYIKKYVKERNPDLGILCAASKMVDSDQLKSKEAKLFGCDPDFNVYTERTNPKPNGASTNLRSCGFHIHIGYENYNTDVSLGLVRYLDMYLGIPSVIIDIDKQRRKLYGKAGSFRLTPYGVEYRVLSSAMMKDIKTLEIVWNQTMKAIKAFNEGSYLADPDYITHAINSSDTELAKKIIDQYNIM